MNKKDIKAALHKLNPDNKTKIKKFNTFKNDLIMITTRQKISESKVAYSLSCFDILNTSVSFCGKYLDTTQYCDQPERLENFVNYQLKRVTL